MKRTLSHTPFAHPCIFRSIKNRSSRAHTISQTLVYLTEVAVLRPGAAMLHVTRQSSRKESNSIILYIEEKGEKRTVGNIQATKNQWCLPGEGMIGKGRGSSSSISLFFS